jgi:hypothetical protein
MISWEVECLCLMYRAIKAYRRSVHTCVGFCGYWLVSCRPFIFDSKVEAWVRSLNTESHVMLQ